MSQFITFLDLLGRLKAQNSSWSRMKLLSQLWQFLSQLSREQRKSLLLEFGLQEGEQRIERFLSAPGSHSEEILAWTDEFIQAIDPDRVEELARKNLGAEKTRTLMAALGLFGRDSQLDPQATRTEREEETTNSEMPQETAPGASSIFEGPPPPPDDTNTEVKPPGSSERPAPPESGSASAPETTGPPPAEAVRQLPAGPGRNEEAAGDRESPEASPLLTPAETGVSRELAAGSTAPDAASSPPAPAGAEIEATRSLWERWSASGNDSVTCRYRTARELLGEQERLDLPLAEAVIDAFSPGWMRRRLLLGIFHEHSRDAAVVRFLIGKLSTASDFRWFAGALLKSGEPLPLPLEEFLSRVPTASMRRSLAGKLREKR